MKILYRMSPKLWNYTREDVNCIGAFLFDCAFFAFLVVTSGVILVVSLAILAFEYCFSGAVTLLNLCRGSRSRYADNTVLLDDGTLATLPEQRNQDPAHS